MRIQKRSYWGPNVSGAVTEESMLVDVVGHEEKEGQEYLSSAPVKTVSGKNYMPDSLKLFV